MLSKHFSASKLATNNVRFSYLQWQIMSFKRPQAMPVHLCGHNQEKCGYNPETPQTSRNKTCHGHGSASVYTALAKSWWLMERRVTRSTLRYWMRICMFLLNINIMFGDREHPLIFQQDNTPLIQPVGRRDGLKTNR